MLVNLISPNRTPAKIPTHHRRISLIRFSLSLIILCFFLISSANVWASQFEYQLQNKVQTDSGEPSLTVRAAHGLKNVEVVLTRNGQSSSSHKLGNMRAGEQKKVTIKQPRGTFSYTAEITAHTSQDEPFSETLNFDVSWVDPIEIAIDPMKVRVGDGVLPFHSNRPIERVELEIFDANNRPLGEYTRGQSGQSGNLSVQWPAAENVGAIRMTAHDVDGFWAAVILEPFWVEIPHQEIVFHNGKATWDDSETPKLEYTLEQVQKAIREHAAKGLQMQLYIAGYTDTVGSAASNQTLSANRAQAVGKWFRSKGLTIPVYTQGFGESVLAVETADETPEPRNRRALYILGNSPPPTSKNIPRADWRSVR